jgi:hypothetical protein
MAFKGRIVPKTRQANPVTTLDEPKRSGESLNSWKEIADYLGVSMRTAQRWRSRGLPVRSSGAGHPIAFPKELQSWRKNVQKSSLKWHLQLRRILAAAAVILFLGAGASYWLIRGVHRTPAGVEVQGLQLRVTDSGGKAYWDYPLPEAPAPQSWGLGVNKLDEFSITDVDHDSRVELLYNFLPAYISKETGRLYCFEQDGRLRWVIQPGRWLRQDSRELGQDYLIWALRSVMVRGKPMILSVASHRRWAVSQVALLNPIDGRVIEEFWHPGVLTHCLIQELDGDDTPEVILAGINNPGQGPGRAVLMLLELPFSRVPVNRESQLSRFSTGGPRHYLMFPRSDSSYRLGVEALITQLTIEGSRYLSTTLRLNSQGKGAMTFILDQELGLKDFRWTADLAYLHDELWHSGHLNHAMTPTEIRCLGQAISFQAVPDGNDPSLQARWRDCELATP